MSVFIFLAKVSYEIPTLGLLNKIYSYTVNICLFVYLFKYNDNLYKFYVTDYEDNGAIRDLFDCWLWDWGVR